MEEESLVKVFLKKDMGIRGNAHLDAGLVIAQLSFADGERTHGVEGNVLRGLVQRSQQKVGRACGP